MHERDIFEKAIEIRDRQQREAFLNEACGTDANLRRQLDELLASHDQSSGFLQVPVVEQFESPASSGHQPTVTLPPSNGANRAESPESREEDDDSGSADLSFLQPSDKPGSIGRLGHYEIVQILGQGAFGIVFKAFDEKLHRYVAVKTMSPQLAATSPPRKRFLREARSVAALKHENIVQVHAVEEQPLPYLVMEFVDGQTLQQKLDGTGPLDIAEILHLGRQIAAGLAAAHEKGLIHRDIKPGNILIEAGFEQKVKITDFGLARAADDATMTRTGMIAGTPMYMAPEQAQGLALDHRADLFSLGSVLYQMTSGRPPFRGATTLAVLKRVTEEAPRPIQQILAEAPDWLCTIIAKLHAKNPDERFQSARVVAELLARCQTSLQQNRPVELPAELLTSPSSTGAAPSTNPEQTPALPQASRTRGHDQHKQASSRRTWRIAAAVLVTFIGGLGLAELAQVTNVRGVIGRWLETPGTLIIQTEEPGIRVSVGDREIVLAETAAQEIQLKPGDYQVVALKDGLVVHSERITVVANRGQACRIPKVHSLQSAATATATTATAATDRGVQFRTGGDWQLDGDELAQELPENARLLFGDPEWTDYDVEVEAMSQGKQDGHGIILMYRAQDLANFLDLEVGGWSATVTEAVFFKKGIWGRSPGCFLKVPHEHNRWYKIKVEVRGPRISCWVNGKNVFTYRDESLNHGMIGLGTGNSPVRWRRLKVTAPDGRVLWEGFPDIQEPASLEVEADRRAFAWALSVGCGARIRIGNQVEALKKGSLLPNDRFEILELNFYHLLKLADQDFEKLAPIGRVTGKLILHQVPKLGDDGFTKLASYQGFADIQDLTLNGTKVTDVGLAHLVNFKRLRRLELSCPVIGRQGCAVLGTLPLEHLTLYECHEISDEAYAELAKSESLASLSLVWTPVSDVGLKHLGKCKSLRKLTLQQCNERAQSFGRESYTETTLQQLSESRPDLLIEVEGKKFEPATP